MSNNSSPSEQTGSRLPARSGTVVWGGILLLVAAIAATATFVDASVYSPRFILWAIVGFGGLLVVAGVVGAIARITTSRVPTTTAPDPAPSKTEPVAGGLFE